MDRVTVTSCARATRPERCRGDLALLLAVGWAYTDESPLGIMVLALSTGMASIAGVVQALAGQSALATVLIGALAGTIGTYVGTIGGYVLWLYIGSSQSSDLHRYALDLGALESTPEME